MVLDDPGFDKGFSIIFHKAQRVLAEQPGHPKLHPALGAHRRHKKGQCQTPTCYSVNKICPATQAGHARAGVLSFGKCPEGVWADGTVAQTLHLFWSAGFGGARLLHAVHKTTLEDLVERY